MIRIELATLMERLNDSARHALEEAASLAISQAGAEVTVSQLLFKLIDNPFSDVRLILKQAAVEPDALKHALAESFDLQNVHEGQYPAFSPLLIELLQEAWLLGSLELREESIRSGSILLALLLNPARYLPLSAIRCLEVINRETLRKNFAALLADSAEVPKAPADAGGARPITSEAQTALGKYGLNFSQRAVEGRIDPVLGRDDEIDLMIDILSRRRKNNPIAVGDAGVGKSALVEGLALRIAQGRVPEDLKPVQLWGLDMGALQAGASVKGEFEKRLKAVIDEVKSSPVPIILFIDEAHTMIGAGNQAGGSDAANLLKPALARGELRTIAATTWSEYKQYFEKDPALSRRFQLVKLMEPSIEQTVHMLRGLRTVYEAAHQVYISDAALQAAAALSARYVAGRQLPDKAIDVLDTACARVATALAGEPRRLAAIDNAVVQVNSETEMLTRDLNSGKAIDPARIGVLAERRIELAAERERIAQAWEQQKVLVEQILAQRALVEERGQADTVDDTLRDGLRELVEQLRQVQREGALLHADVGEEQIAQVIAGWTGIPVSTISGDQMKRLSALPEVVKADVKGQGGAVDHIHRHLLTAMADLRRPGTPLGAFLLVGPSGVGKTETALRIADHLFGGKQFLTVINMSEYQEKHTVSRLLGAPPGYVGYGEGGVLTEAIRQKPYSVVLLDEVEKAHPEVLNIFYQAFDKGEVADGEGRLIDCKNILFFLTSNLGFEDANGSLERLDEETMRTQLSRFFKPALLARMQVVQYGALDEAVLADIVDHRLARLQKQFAGRYGATLRVTDAVRDILKSRCVRHANGARMLDASIDGELLPPLSLSVLNRLANGEPFTEAVLDAQDQKFVAELT
ncbi:type VI secretion system ATPase TssH [Pseudoxanthomonas putridarboris]|uniref:Type VI secretion system ATPase TssH n=1 Tax=Pseudoxanthomonas putridarboris TaxID=752605 RepID=A0ABU9J538_9GAMM